MAQQNVGGLPIDISQLPTIGASEDDLSALRQAQQDYIDALQQRYAQPNWWKVAAGFAKPQLGGFLASLGSAEEAMGENLEQRRGMQLPIAQAKAQIAQTNYLMKRRQDVNGQISQWKQEHGDALPPPDVLANWEQQDPGNTAVSANKAEIADLRQQIELASKANIPLNKRQMEYVQSYQGTSTPHEDTTQAAQPSATQAPETPVENAKPGTIYVMPNGARLTEDAFALQKHGIPIISNFRTQEDQDNIPRDPNNPNLTKEGRPITKDVGIHGTGNAIDLDPNAKLKQDQIDLLHQNGWSQPVPDKDPNHWIKAPSSKPVQQVGFYPMSAPKPDTAGMGDADRQYTMKQWSDNAAAKEAPFANKVASLSEMMVGPAYTTMHNQYETAANLIQQNPERANRVMSLVRNNGQLAAALNAGIGVHLGSFGANVSLPVQPFLDAGLSESDKVYADKLFSALQNIGTANLKSQGVQMKAGTQQEYMYQLKSAAHMDEMPMSALNKLHHDMANFDNNKEFYDTINNERTTKANPLSATPLTDIVNNSPRLKSLEKKYSIIHKRYDDDFQKALSGETK